MATFPLKCTICSDEHSYSDVSHLLTHMSSKRHLATHFKATVRARQDSTLAQKLNEFDLWYNQNNLGDLLAHRLAKKDEKKIETKVILRKQRNVRKTRKGISKENAQEQQIRDTPAEEYDASITIPIDPNMLIKQEPASHGEVQDDPHWHLEQNVLYGQPYHSIETSEQEIYDRPWSFTEPLLDDPKAFHLQSEYSSTSGPLDLHSIERKPYADHLMLESVDNADSLDRQPMRSFPERLNGSSEDAENENHQICPQLLEKVKTSKLKGIIWPGMRLFDAASAEGTRMRNQRKRTEISLLLERSSQQTQPTEMVYYGESWMVKEDRVIDGEIHSPPPDNMPTRVKRQKRKALAEKSVNKIIGKRGRRRGKSQKFLKAEDRQISSTPNPSEGLPIYDEQHNSSSLHDDRSAYGSPLKFESPGSQYNDYEYRLQTTAYPLASSHSFQYTGPMSGGTMQTSEEGRLGLPFHLAPVDSLHNVSDLHEQTVNDENMDPCGSYQRQNLDESPAKVLTIPQGTLYSTQDRQRLLPISYFDHFYSLTHRERHTGQLTDTLNVWERHDVLQQSYRQDQVLQTEYMPGANFNQPQTPIKRENTYGDRDRKHKGLCEDSSGDETIDQNVNSPAALRLTRSVTPNIKSDPF